MARTKTEAALEAAEEEHADDPERVELLQRARRFKTSWIELGEGLIGVRRSASWKRWGYASLEEYAKSELHLRADTVEKLTGSFMFLKNRAPEVLERDGLGGKIPTYQAVDFLRRAEEREDAPRDVVEEIRRRVIDDATPLPAVAKEYREVVFPRAPEERLADDAAGLRNVGKRLHELLAETKAVPRGLAADVSRAVQRLLEALAESEAA